MSRGRRRVPAHQAVGRHRLIHRPLHQPHPVNITQTPVRRRILHGARTREPLRRPIPPRQIHTTRTTNTTKAPSTRAAGAPSTPAAARAAAHQVRIHNPGKRISGGVLATTSAEVIRVSAFVDDALHPLGALVQGGVHLVEHALAVLLPLPVPLLLQPRPVQLTGHHGHRPTTGTAKKATAPAPSAAARHPRSAPVSNSGDTFWLNKSRAWRIAPRAWTTTSCPSGPASPPSPPGTPPPTRRSRRAPARSGTHWSGRTCAPVPRTRRSRPGPPGRRRRRRCHRSADPPPPEDAQNTSPDHPRPCPPRLAVFSTPMPRVLTLPHAGEHEPKPIPARPRQHR